MVSFSSVNLALLACLHLSAASSLYAGSFIGDLDIRATDNCTDPRTMTPDPQCWDELDISDYLAGWNRTTPTCQATGDADDDRADCCHPQEPWSTCFLRISYGSEGTQCVTINPQACELNAMSLGKTIAPMAGYVVRNIVEINYRFTSYYYALQGQSSTINGVDSISAKLQQSMKSGVTLDYDDIVRTILASLPFWATPAVLAWGTQQINTSVDSAAADAFAQSLQNAPGISSILFGAANGTSQGLTMGSDLTQNLTEAGVRLQSALTLIMTDVPTFIAWAAHGLYSGPSTALNAPPADVGMTSAFDTYLIGQALCQSHFSATPWSTTDSKESFQQGRTCTTLGDVCQDDDGTAYYWSQAYQTQYTINEPGKWASGSAGQQLGSEVDAYGLLEYIETTDVYMPVLFDGAYNCTFTGKAGGFAININPDYSLDVACLSALPIYLSHGSSCPDGAVWVGGKCPFGFMG